ncbi:hypothetical protein, conserved [Trypanosoma brucei gambiense DAL972]|uniref:Cell cycle checkpoint protein RAD1 n=2 Tax=Trypanosoma brucei TaxID=5691 RepID=C9ZI59_TRYB9|nr:hypothetical protein, conserved [Trypanosoma brucei gambiense DAL972]RHW74276.1 Cell cycle checkpoint protein RAD1-like [Trypanosoma brucei equiperdum]CBH08851.1 hypothetical protein, conserved [Trypanosoma brucei gambiense DAL972]|eukprot:XP_011771292.1 hypothetical protein, conserved [Trypanosoma brucei gambiense DAL972]
MSVQCQVAHPYLLLKSLSLLTISKDAWAEVEFTESSVTLDVEGAGQSATATAVLPTSIFSQYTTTGVRFAVHLGMFRNALLLGGPSQLNSMSTSRVVLSYPTKEARLLVELSDGKITLRSKLITQRPKEYPLDLQFSHARVLNQVTLPGDAARAAIEDLVTAQCSHAVVTLDPREGVLFRGEGGPYGSALIKIPLNSDVISSIFDGDERVETHVLQSHLVLVCGVRSGGKQRRNTLVPANDFLMGPNSNGGGGYGQQQAAVGGFERLMLQINEARQLSVVHMLRERDIPVTVTLVVSPIYNLHDQ